MTIQTGGILWPAKQTKTLNTLKRGVCNIILQLEFIVNN